MSQIAVIVSDANAAAHIGGEVERSVRLFHMPEGMREYIQSRAPKGSGYVSVSLAIEDEQ